MKCSICGIELMALNMSDIEEDKCQDCVRKILDNINTEDESAETRHMPDMVLDSIIRRNDGRIRNDVHDRQRRQRVDKYGISRRRIKTGDN